MDEPQSSEALADEDAFEVVDALPVLPAVRSAEPTVAVAVAREPATVGLVQTAAVAATGFVAGIATAAVLGRRRQRRQGQLPAAPRPQPAGGLEVVSTRTYLVDVHLLQRRT